MQVCDAGRALRATLNAASFLIELRGYTQLRPDESTLDIAKLLARRETIEALEPELFKVVAESFVCGSLRHAARRKFAYTGASGRRRNSNNADVDDSETVDASLARRVRVSGGWRLQAIRVGAQVMVASQLVKSAAAFSDALEPYIFENRRPLAERTHAALDYDLALLVHTGLTMAQTNRAIECAIRYSVKLREDHAERMGVAKIGVRVFLVLWGDTFHPTRGTQYRTLQRDVGQMNDLYSGETGVSLEAWSVFELQYDATKHHLAPQFTALNDAEASAERALRNVSRTDHRQMLDSDVQARARGFDVGQLVAVDRCDLGLGGHSRSYVVVGRADPARDK
jgi:hypothetical protein